MGDHRASIKIEASFHGVERKCDMWINYCDSDGNGVDSRVTEFFSDLYEAGMFKYNTEMAEYYAKRDKEKIEQEEKQTLARLKNKYERIAP